MTLPVPSAATWYTNQLITGAMIDQYVVDPVNALNSRTSDGGWVNVTAAFGYTGVGWQVRLIGPQVFIQGHVNANSPPWPTSLTTVGTLPSTAYAPTVDLRVTIPAGGSSAIGGLVFSIAAGSTNIQIAAPSSTSAVSVYTALSWMAN